MKGDTELSLVEKYVGYLSFTVPYMIAFKLTLAIPVSLLVFPKSLGAFVVLPYLIYTLGIGRYELTDGQPRHDFSQHFFVFRAMRRFLQIEIREPPTELKTAEQAPNAQFVLAMFPHAVWSDYHASMDGMWHTVFPNIYGNIRTLGASVLFRLPLVREWTLWTGGIDARRSVAEQALDRGRTILVRPGGEAEQLRTTRGREIVYLQHRKGFIRLAMQKQVPVVPTYVFGASDYHYTWGGMFALREWIQKRFGVCLPIAFGYWGSLCPLPVRTTVVFGKPLSFEMKEKGNPARHEVDAAHKQFCGALRSIFDQHKKTLGYGDRQLEIV
jgi:1-acyl-sn-glycerol-3-phosphate acyltransferase